MTEATVREVLPADRGAWVRMREALWPGSLAEHEAETRRYFDGGPPPGYLEVVFVAELDGRTAGFLELGLRAFAPGCDSTPVPFIEGWYVEEDARRRGVGRALAEAAEAWARAAGHREIASDVEIANAGSIAAHGALGYAEVERVAFFRKGL